ncbi:hypothetical protein DBR32_13610 [Taibaiella sp. KBW10]|uniref:GEVED domain-containing protein n=1 Tax=Taibaiella sp. KBW10 TaxID=2153357 RepID=UPI000F5AB7EF|nr:GEVED domain-containing protein [Taibaiella sp. KBW10]RQO29948.1 hypothetical protein DBR32_13610 [Taibaiella sp. KBW10]
MNRRFTISRQAYLISFLLMLFNGIAQKTWAQTYCTPPYTLGCAADFIQSFSTTGGSTNISNLNSGASTGTGCVSNQTAMVHTTSVGNTINFSILNCPGWSEGYKIFVDWNEDGDFVDPGELVYNPTATLAGGGTAAGSFVVPVGTTAGNKRMRVRCVFSSVNFDACNSQSFGEAEDYTITVIPLTPCTNPPSPGTIATSVPDSICPNITFSLATTGNSFGSGLVYQWEQSPTGVAGSWVNIAGATTINYAVAAGITTNTYYRLKSICSGGTPVFSNEKMVAVKSFINCYCNPTYTSGCTNGGTINSFSTSGAIANVSNLNTGCATGALGYSNYSSMVITAAQTFAFNFNVAISSFASGVKIWADWNHDGVFDPVTELCAQSATTIPVGTSFTGTITPPATALTGNTRIRVRAVEGTTTFTPCSSQSFGETEDYTINLVVPPACTTVTFPSNVHAIANPRALCVSGNVALTIDSLMPQATGITYQWQSAPGGAGPWTNVGTATTTSPTTITGLTTTTYYRMQVLCSGNVVVTSSTDTVTVTNPGTVTAVNGQRCGPGQVTLGATPSVGSSQVSWYTAATGGTAIGTGTPFNTPYITNTTTFYATAGAGATTYNTGKLTPTSTTGNSGFSDVGLMFNALTSFTLQSVDVYPMSATSTTGTITIALKNAAGVTLQSTTANVTVSVAGALNTVPLNFTVPTGTGYRLVVTAATGMSNLLRESVTGFTFPYTVPGVSSITSAYTGGSSTTFYYYFYKWVIKVGCESPRVPVVATVNAGPAVTKAAPPVVCNNAIATLSMTPPATANPYVPYVWYPTTDLYTNAAATIPYTGGTANTVYMKSSVAGQHTYYAIGGDTTATSTSCSRADTFNVWVQPGNVTIKAVPDTICISGQSILSLMPATDYYTGSIQWQESLDGGVTYSNLAGATNVTYTTATLTANRTYRANITANGATCSQPTKLIVVANPTFISKRDSFNCGPGQVTLQATTGGNSNPRWYENPTGGSPIGGGSVWQTPFLTQTDTFYVVAGTGSTVSSVNIGSGTTVSTGAVTPYYSAWGGYRHQYLITAAELTAAGATIGATINSLAFDVVSNGTTYNGFAVSMGQTTATALTTATWLPVTQVKAPLNWTTTAGYNTYNFDVPFTWDGTSNIVVQTCWSNNNTSNTVSTVRYHTTPFVSAHYNNQDNVTPAVKCSNTTAGSTISQRPNMRLGIKPCESSPRQMVIATINPLPAPNLGADIDTCINQGNTITLNPGTIPNTPTYVWDDASTNATRGITQTGTYNVAVTNIFGCVGRDTINVNMKWNPVVDLASGGVNLCLGGTKVLDAGNGGLSGGNYYWNTGATSRTITISNVGTYIAYVTSNQGCLTTDTVTITSNGSVPTIDAIITQPLSASSFKFSTLNPQNVTSFIWDFGDGSAPVTILSSASSIGLTTHVFPAGGNYKVKLKTFSICGDIVDSTMISIIGLGAKDIDKDAKLVQVYPNPNNGNILYVEAVGDVKIKDMVVYNALGQEVLTINKFDNTSKHKVTLPEYLASGVYNLRINTSKGLTTRKLEIVK